LSVILNFPGEKSPCDAASRQNSLTICYYYDYYYDYDYYYCDYYAIVIKLRTGDTGSKKFAPTKSHVLNLDAINTD